MKFQVTLQFYLIFDESFLIKIFSGHSITILGIPKIVLECPEEIFKKL